MRISKVRICIWQARRTRPPASLCSRPLVTCDQIRLRLRTATESMTHQGCIRGTAHLRSFSIEPRALWMAGTQSSLALLAHKATVDNMEWCVAPISPANWVPWKWSRKVEILALQAAIKAGSFKCDRRTISRRVDHRNRHANRSVPITKQINILKNNGNTIKKPSWVRVHHSLSWTITP